MHVVAVEAHRRHHQRTVAVELAVDVAATVLAVPLTLLIENVVQIRIGAQRGLLAQITLNISTARIGKRGKGEHGHVAELRIAATVIEDCLRGGGIKHSDLGQDRSGLSAAGADSTSSVSSAGAGSAATSASADATSASADATSADSDSSATGSSAAAASGPWLHRRDKAGRHTVEFANAGKRALDILGTRLGHSCHVTLGGLARASRLGLGCPARLGLRLRFLLSTSAISGHLSCRCRYRLFPIHDTPPRTKRRPRRTAFRIVLPRPTRNAAIPRASRDDRGCSGCAGTR